MFAQILLGITIIIFGICHLSGIKSLLGKNMKTILRGEALRSFQKGLALPLFLLGILFITMGIVERANILARPIFITLYIVLSCIPLAMVLCHNKKHAGRYFLW